MDCLTQDHFTQVCHFWSTCQFLRIALNRESDPRYDLLQTKAPAWQEKVHKTAKDTILLVKKDTACASGENESLARPPAGHLPCLCPSSFASAAPWTEVLLPIFSSMICNPNTAQESPLRVARSAVSPQWARLHQPTSRPAWRPLPKRSWLASDPPPGSSRTKKSF